MSNDRNRVNQKGAQAHGDIVGRDKTTIVQLPAILPSNAIARLVEKLREEVAGKAEIAHVIEKLQRFSQRRDSDGVVGLEEKLRVAGRDSEVRIALEQKEIFAKALERWTLYGSAQEILGHLLAKAEVEFRLRIIPRLGDLDTASINEIVSSQIVTPIVEDCAVEPLNFDHVTIMGMLYWLAEQCFIHWHAHDPD